MEREAIDVGAAAVEMAVGIFTERACLLTAGGLAKLAREVRRLGKAGDGYDVEAARRRMVEWLMMEAPARLEVEEGLMEEVEGLGRRQQQRGAGGSQKIAMGRMGERVRRMRKRKGLSQASLAGRSGVEQSRISRLERGEAEVDLVMLERLARGMGMGVDEMMGG